jgi:putative ABC transport system permease protein
VQSPHLSLTHLAIAFIPVFLVLALMWKNKFSIKKPLVALARMLLQLLFVGYFLLYLFSQQSMLIIMIILCVMMLVASWIALNVVERKSWSLYFCTLISLLLGGLSVLVLITQGVLQIAPWYDAQIMIPLAGMIFSSSMTGISIALERFQAEMAIRKNMQKNSRIAFQAAMIPVVNTMFAVGVVALPGMMTGQILSGVAPYIAARYQIMVMCMIFSATGLSVYLLLTFYRYIYKN